MVNVNPKKTQQGSSLIEALTTIAIVGILASSGLPNYNKMIVTNQIAVQANEFVTDLALARSDAAKLGKRVSVCASSDGVACSGTNWTQGRIVFEDTGVSGVVDGTDKVLRVMGSLSGTSTLVPSDPSVAYVQYYSDGTIASSGQFTLCHASYTGNIVAIANTGRVSVSNTSSVCA